MDNLAKDLCGAIIGFRVAGLPGAVAGAIICHVLFSDE